MSEDQAKHILLSLMQRDLPKKKTHVVDVTNSIDPGHMFVLYLQYFFGYKVFLRVFSFQNNPETLDPSYRRDLDLLDCLGRIKLIL